MFEQITLIGHVGADPEMRLTPSGKAVTDFSGAANAHWTNGDGTLGERVTWYGITCCGSLAEVPTTNTRRKVVG